MHRVPQGGEAAPRPRQVPTLGRLPRTPAPGLLDTLPPALPSPGPALCSSRPRRVCEVPRGVSGGGEAVSSHRCSNPPSIPAPHSSHQLTCPPRTDGPVILQKSHCPLTLLHDLPFPLLCREEPLHPSAPLRPHPPGLRLRGSVFAARLVTKTTVNAPRPCPSVLSDGSACHRRHGCRDLG